MKSYETIPDETNFQAGIPFNVKLIGSMEISRPTSRVEIVAAMRRVRFEFKAKGVKKKKVTVTISTDGICTSLRSKNKRKRRMRSSQVQYKDVDMNNIVLINHPIYRIFYVCHDSQDVKIFSYISRETSSNVFNCSVFKASKKSQALRIVRTVGEAFEVSHKLTSSPENMNEENEVFIEDKPTDKQNSQTELVVASSTTGSSAEILPLPSTPVVTTAPVELISLPVCSSDEPKDVLVESPEHRLSQSHSPSLHHQQQHSLEQHSTATLKTGSTAMSQANSRTTKEHEVQLLKEKLDAQTQNTQAALAQIHLLRDQLSAESNARIEAQTRTHQLLQQNRELLDHLQSLMRHIHELEVGGQKSLSPSIQQHVPLPQVRSGSPSSTSSTATATPPFSSFQELDNLRRQNLFDSMYFENRYRVPYYTPPFGFFNGGFARDFYSSSQPPPPPPPLHNNYSNLMSQGPPPSLSQQNYCQQQQGSPQNSQNFMSSASFAQQQMQLQQQQQQLGLGGSMTMSSSHGSSSSPCGVATSNKASAQFILPIVDTLPIPKLGQIGRKTSEEYRKPVTNTLGRSVSEKIGHKSELMSQVNRNAWARHTTK